MDLEGKTAVVTGGRQGIGKTTAIELAKQGATVAIGDIEEEPKSGGKTTVEEITELGRNGLFVRTDVTDTDNCERLISRTIDEFGGIDILVNNAGAFPQESRGKRIDQLEPDEWDTIIDINLTGVYNCSHAALSHLSESDAGRVVNISSKMGLVGHKESPAYSAAKGGVVTLSKQMAIDFASDAVTVNTVCPGIILTGTKRYRMEQKGDRMKANTPLPYLGKPIDIARAVAFLASDGGRFITGQTLTIDGGWTAQ